MVVHLAGLAGVRNSFDKPARYQYVNVCGTTCVLEAARRAGIPSAILASSSSVYGDVTNLPFVEDHTGRPLSPYAASKRAMELAASVYHYQYGMDILCPRFFTVFGPRQRPDMAIAQFVRLVRAHSAITLFGNGSTQRDYTFVSDIVDGLVASIDQAKGMGFQVYNLGSSVSTSLHEVVCLVAKLVGYDPKLKIEPERKEDVRVTRASITKASQLFNYQPKVTFEKGLRRYVEWLDASTVQSPQQ
jgi:UDP-glucuronate 4-epimerase